VEERLIQLLVEGVGDFAVVLGLGREEPLHRLSVPARVQHEGEHLGQGPRERGRRVLHPRRGPGIPAIPGHSRLGRSPREGVPQGQAGQQHQPAQGRQPAQAAPNRRQVGSGRQLSQRGVQDSDHQRGPKPHQQAQGRQKQHRDQHGRAGFGRLLGTGAAGLAQEDDAADLGKAGDGQPADQGQPPQTDGPGQRVDRAQQFQGGHEHQELADEAVEGGQAADGRRADQEGASGSGHAPQEAPRGFDLQAACGLAQRAGAHEEKALEPGVVPDVQQAPTQAQGSRQGTATGEAQKPQTQPQGDDPEVLDAVTSQQALEIVLGQGEDHAQDP